MPERRTLSFDGLDGVIPEVERLLAGHETVGRWTLGQILYHLALSFALSIEGERESEPDHQRDRMRVYRRLFFRAGRFPENTEAPMSILMPPDSCEVKEQAAALREVIGRFKSEDGPFALHPVLGAMGKAEWSKFHALHCAHHLGFASVVPTKSGSPSEAT